MKPHKFTYHHFKEDKDKAPATTQCGLMSKMGWHGEDCEKEHHFICQFHIKSAGMKKFDMDDYDDDSHDDKYDDTGDEGDDDMDTMPDFDFDTSDMGN